MSNFVLLVKVFDNLWLRSVQCLDILRITEGLLDNFFLVICYEVFIATTLHFIAISAEWLFFDLFQIHI